MSGQPRERNVRVVAVIGYNNTRIGDVRKMRRLARKHGAKLLLVKKHPTADDRAAADLVADVDLDDYANGADACQAFAEEHCLDVIAVLPFSDRGVVIGAQWARRLGLPGGDPQTVHVGLDKHAFRRVEAQCRKPRPWYYRPFAVEVATPKDILAGLQRSTRFGMGVYVKPRKEGNSRGGTHVTDEASAATAFEALHPYLREGAVAEEYMAGVPFPFGREFSYDRVGAMSWVTAKMTTAGLYRAEIQHIVPAPLAEADYNRLREAGQAVADFCGAADGACHIEEMLLRPEGPPSAGPVNGHDVGTVEPNLRPAGGRIWDLAEVAFGRSPWEEWLAWAAGRPTASAPLRRRCYAGIRRIPAPCTGEFLGLPEEAVARVRAEFPEVFEVQVTCAAGKVLPAQARDNAEFVGVILAKHQDADRLQLVLRRVTDFLSQQTRIKQ
jgi:hypothetical protein